MTAYATYATTGAGLGSSNTSLSLFIQPGSYEIRIPQIVLSYEMYAQATILMNATVGYYPSGSSGGSTVACTALRQGSPAATATATQGGSGSGTFLTTAVFVNGNVSTGGTGTTALIASSNEFSTPFDFIISPGSALCATINGLGGTGYEAQLNIVAYFEELRLSWHY